jgi:ABC-type uncharacterized transport system auxiliary subunit
MTSISRLTSLTLLTALATGLAGCMHAEDPVTQYIQRSDKVTLSAGNANQANLAIHMVDPWPRASADRRIPANGQRMSDTYERYRDVTKVPPRPVLNPPNVSPSTGGAASSATK